MTKTFTHSTVMRLFWGITGLFAVAIWVFLIFSLLETPRAYARILLFIFTLLFLGFALYAFYALITSFSRVVLHDFTVSVTHFGQTITVAYEEISNIHQNWFFLVLTTANGRILIERHIGNFQTLHGYLKKRIPAMRQAKREEVIAPLPRRLDGKPSTLFIGLAIVVVFWLFCLGLSWNAFTERETSTTILAVVFDLLFLPTSALIGYEMVLRFPRYAIFDDDDIVVRRLTQQEQFTPSDLTSIRLERRKHKQKSYFVLVLQFQGDQELQLSEDHFRQSIPQLLEVLEHHYDVTAARNKQKRDLPHTHFGTGSQHAFSWYLEGDSTVNVTSVDGICNWLRGCAYIHDRVLFMKRDFWQHPVTFEQVRKGDCEDHALWAWRKLIELNIPAEFIVGHARWSETDNGAHAWVVLMQDGRPYILEATAKNKMLFPLDWMADRYHPWYGIDQDLNTYHYTRYVDGDDDISPDGTSLDDSPL